jgi:hypothetical protein
MRMTERAREKISELSVGVKIFAGLLLLVIILFAPLKGLQSDYAKRQAQADEDHRILVEIRDWLHKAPYGMGTHE